MGNTGNLSKVDKRKVNINCARSILKDVLISIEDGDGEHLHIAKRAKKEQLRWELLRWELMVI